MKYAIAYGNLVEGYVMYGPFDTPGEARDWASLHTDDDNDVLVYLNEPEEDGNA